MSNKPIVEGGLLTAIAVILGLASIYLPVFGLIIEFFCAVPIVVLTVRQGAAKGFLALTASFILLTIFVGPLLSIRNALSFGVCGLVLGWCINKGYSAVKSFIATLITAFIAQIIVIGIVTLVLEIDVIDTEMTAVQETFDETFKIYEEIGVDKETIADARRKTLITVHYMKYLLPIILLLMAVLNTVACYLTAQLVFKKLRLKFVEPMPPFAEWRFPQVIFYIASFAILGAYWGGTRNWIVLQTVSLNTAFIAMSIGLIQGLAVLSCAADKYEVSKFVRRIIFVIIILNMLTLELVAITGLFDMLFDYRARWINR